MKVPPITQNMTLLMKAIAHNEMVSCATLSGDILSFPRPKREMNMEGNAGSIGMIVGVIYLAIIVLLIVSMWKVFTVLIRLVPKPTTCSGS